MIDSFNWLDVAILLVVVLSTALSLKRGFFNESFSLVIWLFAIFCSYIFSDALSVYLHEFSDSPSIRKLIAMGILFVAALIAGGLVRLLVSQLITFTGLSATDRVLGMVFGALRGLLIVIVIFLFTKKVLPVEQEAWYKASKLAPQITRLEGWTVEKASQLKDVLLPMLRQAKSE